MLIFVLAVSLFLGAHGESDLEWVVSQGYPIEVHNVTTDDGYILQLQRIPYGKDSCNNTSDKTVVFLMHGFLLCFNSFTYLSSDYGIAYNLADAGYDVWMGNARGSRYSRRHVSLDPDEDNFKFFNYTYEEIGRLDLPAMFDYVLATTKQEKMHYIGHSQGGAVFYVLNSLDSTYQSKIASAHLLTGIGYQYDLPNKIVKLISQVIDVAYSVLLLTGNVEIKSTFLNLKLFEVLVNATTPHNMIAGAAVKQIVHFCQNIKVKEFRRFDFGTDDNLVKYGSVLPPAYDLSKIYINVTVHYSLGDLLQSEIDALAMVKAMPNAKARKIARSDFDHMDYLLSEDVKELVTDYIIQSFKNF